MNCYLESGARLPEKAHEDDAGWDLFARNDTSDKIIYPGQAETFDTGVHIAMPISMAGHLESKSGLNIKHGVLSFGLIDPGYRGAICVKLYNFGAEPYTIHAGDKISQILFVPIADTDMWQVDSLDTLGSSKRGMNGFGSSGR